MNGQKWAIVTHFLGAGGAGNWTSAQLLAMCNAFMAGWTGTAMTYIPTSTVFTTVTGVDIGTTAPASAVSTHATVSGGEAGGTNNDSACVLVNYKTTQRYRGGHPRTYLPGMGTGHANGQQWNATELATYGNMWAALISSVQQAAVSAGQATCALCNINYQYSYEPNDIKHKYDRIRTGVKAVTPVSGTFVYNPLIATQRRRLSLL